MCVKVLSLREAAGVVCVKRVATCSRASGETLEASKARDAVCALSVESRCGRFRSVGGGPMWPVAVGSASSLVAVLDGYGGQRGERGCTRVGSAPVPMINERFLRSVWANGTGTLTGPSPTG